MPWQKPRKPLQEQIPFQVQHFAKNAANSPAIRWPKEAKEHEKALNHTSVFPARQPLMPQERIDAA